MIYARLKDLKAFEKFHPLLLQQICYYSYYEDLEQGVIREYSHVQSVIHEHYQVSERATFIKQCTDLSVPLRNSMLLLRGAVSCASKMT